MRVLPLLLVGLSLLAGCERTTVSEPGPGPTASPQRAASPPRLAEGPLVAFLGDSLAAGLHVDAEEAYPAVLERRLAQEGVPFRLLNAGVSGDTTAGGLRRIDWILRQEPDWVVVELGGNDGLRGTPLTAVEENLRGIVERAQAADARVLLLGMRLPPNYGADYADGFAAVFARVAEQTDVPLVPFFLEGVGGVPELNHPDGIHPTPKGHVRIAENLVPVLKELLSAD